MSIGWTACLASISGKFERTFLKTRKYARITPSEFVFLWYFLEGANKEKTPQMLYLRGFRAILVRFDFLKSDPAGIFLAIFSFYS
jgi:hypothetical protein